MGCLKILSILLAILALLLGLAYRQAMAPLPPTDTNLITSEGGHFIRLSDGRILEYFTAGPSTASKTIILTHGAMQTGQGYIPLLENYANEKGVRMIFPTMPGCGRSSYHENRNLKNYAQDVKELVKELNIKTFSVAGVSQGGTHTVALAYYLNEQVENVLLIVPMSQYYNKFQDKANITFAFTLLLKVLNAPYVKDVVNHYVVGPMMSTEKGAIQFFETSFPYSWPEAEGPLRKYFVSDAMRSMATTVKGLSQATTFGSGNWDFDVGKLSNGKRKVIIVGGMKDDICHLENQKWYHESIKGSELIVGDYGHLFFYSNPKLFHSFLDKLLN